MKRNLIAAFVAFLVSFLFSYVLIPILKRLKAGQNILKYVKEHKNKGGTPTMGGLAFISAATLSAAVFIQWAERPIMIALAIGIAYMTIGFLDDFLKRKHKQNLGLKAWQKLVFQIAIALFSGIYCLKTNRTEIYVPFLNQTLDIGFWILPFSVFVFIATVNAVNLTDGLDGLAAGVSAPFFAALGVLIFLQAPESSFSVLSFSVTGAVIAYLLFNVSPAKVFMGDTGSLSLGGFAAAIGVFTGNALYIAVIGLPFVFSVISVIIQVIYYKATGGKRVFLMAPVHHHFQEKGYSETQISYAYFAITLLLGSICIIAIL